MARERYIDQVRLWVGRPSAQCRVAALLFVWRGRRAKKLTTFGSSEWATKRTMKRAGLLTRTGVFLGKLKSTYIRH